MNSANASKVLPGVPSSNILPWEWLTITESGYYDDHPLPQTPRLRPVRSKSRLSNSNPASPTTSTPSYTPLMSVSPIFNFVDRDPATAAIDLESYIPNIQLAERARVVFSGKAIMVNNTSRRGSLEEEAPSATSAMTQGIIRRRTLHEFRGPDSTSSYKTSSGAPERASVTLRRLRSSTGRPRVETVLGVNKSHVSTMGEGIWWQSNFIDGVQMVPRNL